MLDRFVTVYLVHTWEVPPELQASAIALARTDGIATTGGRWMSGSRASGAALLREASQSVRIPKLLDRPRNSGSARPCRTPHACTGGIVSARAISPRWPYRGRSTASRACSLRSSPSATLDAVAHPRARGI
jgi:hypothetical protein